jgi:hypothetical protein
MVRVSFRPYTQYLPVTARLVSYACTHECELYADLCMEDGTVSRYPASQIQDIVSITPRTQSGTELLPAPPNPTTMTDAEIAAEARDLATQMTNISNRLVLLSTQRIERMG